MEYPADPEYRVAHTDLEVPPDQYDVAIDPDKESAPETPRSKAAGILLFLLYFLYSRTPDLIGVYVPGTVKALSAILLLAVIFGGGIKRAFSTAAVKWLSAFTFWLVLSVPFSYWRGGSMQLLINDWSKAFLLTIATAGLITTSEHARKALIAISIGTLQLAVLSALSGGSGRLQFGEGLAGNPNDLAMYLVMGIPGCLLLASTSGILKRWMGWLGVSLLTVVALKTGSRMGLILLAILFVIVFLRQSPAAKVRFVIAVVVLGAVGWTLTPKDLKDRYRTLWTSNTDVDGSSEASKAVGSTEARKDLLQLGLDVTLQHPLLGVGPGEFGDYVGGVNRHAREARLGFRQTHNTYLQVSSEAGIPAFILYVAAIWVTLSSSFRLSRSLYGSNKYSRYTAEFLFLATVVYATGIMFGAYAYTFFFPVILGIAAAFRRVVELHSPPLLRNELPLSAE
jgi:O-antigen ligase